MKYLLAAIVLAALGSAAAYACGAGECHCDQWDRDGRCVHWVCTERRCPWDAKRGE
jgi:hypothetical protein